MPEWSRGWFNAFGCMVVIIESIALIAGSWTAGRLSLLSTVDTTTLVVALGVVLTTLPRASAQEVRL